MVASVVGREDELATIDAFLASTSAGPAGLRLRGPAGIGKSTLLRATADTARSRGFEVTTCQPNASEATMSYAALTDLLDPFAARIELLPDPQRRALASAMLRATGGGHPPDLRTVGAGTLSLLDGAATTRPVLVAIDDAQWLDGASRRAVAFAVRRCRGAVAVLWTVRGGPDHDVGELSTADPTRTRTLDVEGLGVPAVSDLVRDRVGRTVDRGELAHIVDMSQGNPLFAIELAQAMATGGSRRRIPAQLAPVMLQQVGRLPRRTREILLVASAAAAPTFELLTQAQGDDVGSAVEAAEAAGIVRWDGGRLFFEHPLWREVVHAQATEPQRRSAHRVLGELVDDIEERARHRALGTLGPDPGTVQLLVDAATGARARGAPSSAAELLELARARGLTDDGAITVQAARDHLAAAESERALTLARSVADDPRGGPHRAAALAVVGAITFQTEDFPAAIPILEQAYAGAVSDPPLRAAVAMDLAFALASCGRNPEALGWGRRAGTDARSTGDAALIAEATASEAVVAVINGEPVDLHDVETWLADEDPDRPTSAVRWVVVSTALMCLWSGDLVHARTLFDTARNRCSERGIEDGLWMVVARSAEAAMLDGDAVAASRFAAELADSARLVPDRQLEVCAHLARVSEAAWRGQLDHVRPAYDALLGAAGAGHAVFVLVGMATTGMAELSAGHVAAAHTLLAPVAAAVQALGVSDPVFSPFIADAVETFVATGDVEQAEAYVRLFRLGGDRSGRAWPTGVARRGLALLQAHRGDLADAERSYVQAVEIFGSRDLRYERARTLLLLGRLRRRRRQRLQARRTLEEAAELFDLLGTPRWAATARDELRHLGLTPQREATLTPTEQRVADLAATGLTNAAVATRLSVSPKTVEANLSRVYRKLGIRSRAELGAWIASR